MFTGIPVRHGGTRGKQCDGEDGEERLNSQGLVVRDVGLGWGPSVSVLGS